ncbi:hypothetical protein GCM10007301_52700 [Azorhizobium oxalatiphilum]|uniref:Carrier domain-containing protein n=1 Tax=Azorhizobium oxalatiphilum TaxID=980631 RepID=A0A917FKR0_9HYPH|nr:acyl carrier protein [Azorhizobium oxalatiphilum]GGF86269.1 hypothetical protein GCM10007301_52700 [Azorhizobium oxalatiphilum]
MPIAHDDAERMVREILRQHGKLAGSTAAIAVDADLYRLGLSSLATVNVMMDIETRLDADIPEAALTRETFRTIASLCALVTSLSAASAA